MNQTHREKLIYDTVVPAIVFIITFGYRYHCITVRGISHHGLSSIPTGDYSAGKALQLITMDNASLFEIIMYYWKKILGTDPVTLMLPVLLFGSLTAVTLYKTGYKFAGFPAGIGSAVLYFFSNIHFYYSMQVLEFSFLSFLSAISLYSFLSLYRDAVKTKYLLILTLSNILLLYSHLTGLFVVYIQVLLLLITGRNPEFLKKFLLHLFLLAICSSPILYLIITGKIIIQEALMQTGNKMVIMEFHSVFYNLNNSALTAKMYARLLAAGVIFMMLYPAILKITPLKLKSVWLKTDNFFGILWPSPKPGSKLFSIVFCCFALCFFMPFVTMYHVSFSFPISYHLFVIYSTPGLYLLIATAVFILYRQSHVFSFCAVIILGLASGKHFNIHVNDNNLSRTSHGENYPVKEKINTSPSSRVISLNTSTPMKTAYMGLQPTTINKLFKDENRLAE